jgi:hypothetical protein
MKRLPALVSALLLCAGAHTAPPAFAAQLADTTKAIAPAQPTGATCGIATPGLIRHDDDVVDTGISLSVWVAHTWEVADRFTPASYPATFSTVCIDFGQVNGASSLTFDLVVWDDDGIDGGPGTELGSLPAVATPIAPLQFGAAPSFFSYDISPLALNIDSGSVYIGVRLASDAHAPSSVYLATDYASGSEDPPGNGQDRHDGGPWHPIRADFVQYDALYVRAIGGMLGPVAPALAARFEPALIQPAETSRLTLALRNISQPGPATLGADLVDTLPAGVVIANPPRLAATCGGGAAAADAGGGTLSLRAGAQIPASSVCEVSVDVTSSTRDIHVNTIPAGALVTDLGSNRNPASAQLQIGYLFPQPYCDLPFLWSVEPITRVRFAGIDHTSNAAIDGSPPLEDFTVVRGDVMPGGSYAMQVDGNTAGTTGNVITAYVDWNQDGDFFDAGESFAIGSLVDAGGAAQTASVEIPIPLDALPGTTRLRVVRDQEYPPASDACYSYNFGQAEDYTLTVTPNTAPTVTKQFTPPIVPAGATSTLTITLANPQSGEATLSNDLADMLPDGVVLAEVPNLATDCAHGAVDGLPGGHAVLLELGAKIPGNGSCTVKADVRAAAEGRYVNTIPAGALSTDLGASPFEARATLKAGFTFPEPYCSIDFSKEVDPISRVAFADIDHASDAAVNGTPALEDFTAVIGHVAAGHSFPMAVEGNTSGDVTTVVTTYVDWNHNGVFGDPGETYAIGTLVNSTGSDGQQASTDVTVPQSARAGATRMRVTKNFSAAAAPCASAGFGQAEDYTLLVEGGDDLFCDGFESGGCGSVRKRTVSASHMPATAIVQTGRH